MQAKTLNSNITINLYQQALSDNYLKLVDTNDVYIYNCVDISV